MGSECFKGGEETSVSHALTEERVRRIGDIELSNLRNRLADRHIQLTLTESARTHLVRAGYDPNYGARPLKRAIQKEIESNLARLLLQGKVRDGQTVVVVYDPQRSELTFTPRTAEVEEPAEVTR